MLSALSRRPVAVQVTALVASLIVLCLLAFLLAVALTAAFAPPAEARHSRAVEVALPQITDSGCRDLNGDGVVEPIASYYVDPTPGVTYSPGPEGVFVGETLIARVYAPKGGSLTVDGVNVGRFYTFTLTNPTYSTACQETCS